MALLGKAALAMWWDMASEMRAEFEHWHSHEHFPERLGIPGFLRASRWASAAGGPGFFVLYELADHATLASPAYLARLNAPTPWSTRLMPHHRNMLRSQCHVLESAGGAIARNLLTLRLSPAPGRADLLREHLRSQFARWVQQPGLTAAHLLRTEAPAIAMTEEQRIRGGDGAADWIVLVGGYDVQALSQLQSQALGSAALAEAGAAPGAVGELYALSHTVTAQDVH